MGKFTLEIKASLENVASLQPQDPASFGWNIKFKCCNCGEGGEKFNRIEQQEKFPLPGSRGEANLVVKCKLCSRVNSVDIVEGSMKPYTSQDSEQFKAFLQMDCRGLEPIDYFFGQGFKVTAESGTVFQDVNLEEAEWVEYDEKSSESIGIYSLEYQFKSSK